LKTLRGARVGLLGLAFKPDTDDLRDSPALDVACRLLAKGAIVSAYDPMVTKVPDVPGIRVMSSAFEAVTGADVIVLATEWPQFLTLDLTSLRKITRGDLFLDGRNNFDPERVQQAGFRYLGIGRRSAVPPFIPDSSPAVLPSQGVVAR
jgi:UDP-glucose 6-dehydrogenase